jgi:hypothetical protein
MTFWQRYAKKLVSVGLGVAGGAIVLYAVSKLGSNS